MNIYQWLNLTLQKQNKMQINLNISKPDPISKSVGRKYGRPPTDKLLLGPGVSKGNTPEFIPLIPVNPEGRTVQPGLARVPPLPRLPASMKPVSNTQAKNENEFTSKKMSKESMIDTRKSAAKQGNQLKMPSFLLKQRSQKSLNPRNINRSNTLFPNKKDEQSKENCNEETRSAEPQTLSKASSNEYNSKDKRCHNRKASSHVSFQSPDKNNVCLPLPVRSNSKSRSWQGHKSNIQTPSKVPKFIKQKQTCKSQRSNSSGTSLSKKMTLKGLMNSAQSVSSKEEQAQQACDFEFQINIKPAVHKRSIEDFELVKQLGEGSYGKAYMAIEKASYFVCVLKIIDKSKLGEFEANQLFREIKIQFYLNQEHLTSLYGCFDDDQYIYLVMELLPSGNLKQNLKNKTLPEKSISDTILQVCLGIRHMHRLNILHRDIKPQNIFTFGTYLKLGDFGCSVQSYKMRTSFVGSPVYLSPEQLNSQEYDEKVDIWEIGTLTYEMLFRTCPFEKDIIEMMKGQRSVEALSELKFPPQIPISDELKDFLRRTLAKNRHERMSLEEALQHRFLLQPAQQAERFKLQCF